MPSSSQAVQQHTNPFCPLPCTEQMRPHQDPGQHPRMHVWHVESIDYLWGKAADISSLGRWLVEGPQEGTDQPVHSVQCCSAIGALDEVWTWGCNMPCYDDSAGDVCTLPAVDVYSLVHSCQCASNQTFWWSCKVRDIQDRDAKLLLQEHNSNWASRHLQHSAPHVQERQSETQTAWDTL